MSSALSPGTEFTEDRATVVAVGSSDSTAADVDAGGDVFGGSVGSIVLGIPGKGATVGGSEPVIDSGADVGSAAAAGTGVATAGCIEGAVITAEIVVLGDEPTAVGDGVWTVIGCRQMSHHVTGVRDVISR